MTTIDLGVWEEVVGKLQQFAIQNELLLLQIGGAKLSFPLGSREAQFLQKRIKPQDVGNSIAIMRTDLCEPLAVRYPDDAQENEHSGFMKWYLKTHIMGGML